MMNTYRFYKENTGRWYIDLPDYPGPKADLEMVAGADTMLDVIADGANEIALTVSEEPFKGAEKLRLIKEYANSDGGGDYILEVYKGKVINHEMWLCEVVRYIFGKMPEVIWFKS